MIMKNYKCEICEIDFETFQAKANHVRWNHKDNTSFIESLKGPRLRRIKETISCKKCDKSFDVTYNEGNKKHKVFCSRECSNSRGPRTEEFKKRVSKALRGREYKSPSIILRCVCEECSIEFQTTENRQRRCCSRSCTGKMVNREKRKKNLLSSSFKKIYKYFTKFQFSLRDYPDDFNFGLIEEYGWYKAKNRGNNLSGVSRDHILSVTDGMNQMINPLFLAHPANCRLMRQCDNASKGSESRLTIEELCARIKEWNVDHEEEFSAENPYIEKKDVIAMIAE